MFAIARKVVFGVLTTALVIGSAQMASAKPWPKPWPHPHYGPVVFVNPVTTVGYPANPAPAEIQLVNPNQVALKYTLNGGAVRLLAAGSTVAIYQESVIGFDRGGAAGWNRYSLTSGVYKFIPADGAWALVREAPESTAVAAANPVPAQ